MPKYQKMFIVCKHCFQAIVQILILPTVKINVQVLGRYERAKNIPCVLKIATKIVLLKQRLLSKVWNE